MAAYQLNPVKSVYVSTEGTPTEKQMRGMLAATPNARHYLGFDKDEAGRQFVANFRKVAADMGFRKENVQANHPLSASTRTGTTRCLARNRPNWRKK